MFLGVFTTLCIPETKRKTLEELNGEEDRIVGSSNEVDLKEHKDPNVEETSL